MSTLTVQQVYVDSYRLRNGRAEIPTVGGKQVDKLWTKYPYRTQITSFGVNSPTTEDTIKKYIDAGYNDIRVVFVSTSVRHYHNEYVIARMR